MPQAKTITVRPRGLFDSAFNPWTALDGALLEALNVEIGSDGVLTPRPGMAVYSGAAYAYVFLFNGGSFLIGRRGAGTLAYSYDGVTWVDYAGSYPTLTAGALSAGSVFIPTSSGVYSVDSVSSGPRKAGVAPGLDVAATVSGAGTAIPNNTRVAYRAVFGRVDANGRVLLGAPSSRVVLTNTAGSTQNASVVVTLPADVQNTSHFVQLYRTGASVDQNTDPGDEMYLVYEAALSAVSTVTITDSTPDGLGGASLYTNPSQETILNANAEPPLAYDLAEFGGSLWYANVTFPARRTINLLGVSGTNGLALNDTITVNGQVFTAKAAENVALREFLIATVGTVDENVRATAASLIKCINRTSAAGAYAVDLSEPFPYGIPGVIDIQRNDRTSNLTLAVSRASAWANIVATTAPIASPNGLVYSKPGQPDQIPAALAAAPILAGAGTILRIIPTRNSLWVLKSDGVWRITGTAGQFDVQAFDPTAKIVAAKSAVALDNQAYFLSDQGVARVSESGVEVISEQVSKRLEIPYFAASGRAQTLAVGRERRGQYIVWGYDGTNGNALVYSIRSQAWTRRLDRVGVGFIPQAAVEFGDSARMVVSGVTSSQLHLENDPASLSVPYHSQYSATSPLVLAAPTPVVNSDGTVTLTFGSAISGVLVGDEIVQTTSGAKGRVSSVAGSSMVVIPNRSTPAAFTSSDVAVYSGIPTSTTLFARSPDPGSSVEWTDAVLLHASSSGGASGASLLTGTSIAGTFTATSDSGTSTVPVVRNPGGVSLSSVGGATGYNPSAVAGQTRVSIGREASFGGALVVNYSETAAYGIPADSLAGVVLKFVPGGDGASR